MKYPFRSRHHELFCYLAVVLCALVTKHWVMSRANVFMMDDYSTLLNNAKIGPQGITLLPHKLYNNRPIGDLFYYLTANVFDLNYVLTHAVQILIHAYNGCLVLYILRRFGINRWAAVLGSCIFVAYPMSTMAVQWTSAIYDLLGACFALSALAIYAYHLHDTNRLKYFTATMLLLLYWLSVRTKEATIFLPVLLAMLALYDAVHYRRWAELRRNLSALAPAFAFFIIILFTFVNLKLTTVSGTTVNPNSQYYLSFSPVGMGKKFLEYLNLYSGRHWPWLAGIFLAGLFLMPRLKYALLWAMFVTAILIILPMKNNSQTLYLYFPSVFLVLILAETLNPIFNWLESLWLKPLHSGLCSAGVFLLLVSLFLAYSVNVDAQFLNQGPWIGLAKRHRAQHRDFQKRVRNLDGNEKFLIYNIHRDAHIFGFYGPGNSIRLYTGLPNLRFDLIEKPTVDAATKSKYDVVIRLNKGELQFEKMKTGTKPVNYRVKFYDPTNEK